MWSSLTALMWDKIKHENERSNLEFLEKKCREVENTLTASAHSSSLDSASYPIVDNVPKLALRRRL